MAEIVYLLGAGASYGKRNGILSYNAQKKRDNKIITFGGACPNIIEGLPLVVDIPSRLTYVINEIEKTDINKNIEILLNDLEWLANECKNHATIDTFAKKLYLKKDYTNFF